MDDYNQTVSMLDKAKQPHWHYTQVGEAGNFRIVVLDDRRDGGRMVPLLYFALEDNRFIRAGLRWYDP